MRRSMLEALGIVAPRPRARSKTPAHIVAQRKERAEAKRQMRREKRKIEFAFNPHTPQPQRRTHDR